LNKIKELNGDRKAWAQHFIIKGLKAFEASIDKTKGDFCVGNEITMADIFLVP
jgi:glutathione S-transferase